MMSGRRLVTAAALGLAALVGLSACQSDPAVAAYVDDTEISTARVNGVVDALRVAYEGELEDELANLAEMDIDEAQIADYRAEGRREIDERLSTARDRVLMFLVLTEAGERFAATEEFEPPESDLAGIAESQELPEDHPYVAVLADFSAVVGAAVQAGAEPTEPTEEDQQEAFENMRIEGQPVDAPYEEVEPFLTAEALSGPVGVRNLLAELVGTVEVRVQPGFDLVYQVPVQVGPATSYLGVQISEPSSVVDAG